MSIYAHIKRCLELSERDIISAVADRRTAKALLDQLAKVSRPGDGAPKLLLVFARLASSEVEWIDGALRVEMVGDADVTVVEVLCELGLGMHERVFPSFKMSVPLDEFARAVERVPHMVAPLTVVAGTSRRLVLTAAEDEEQEEAAPPAVAIADDSLYVRLSSKDKIAAVKDPRTRIEPRAASSGKMHPVRRGKSEVPGARQKSIPARSGRTLRPAPSPPNEPAKTSRSTRPDPWPSDAGGSAGAGRAASAPVRVPAVPRPPALPRTDAHTPTPPPPGGSRSVVARVPLTRIQVPRGSRPPAAAASADKATPHARPSKHPKRPSLKPAAKGHSKAPPKNPSKPPPDRRSKAPPPRSIPPKSVRSRAPAALSEPPDEEGIDLGWDEGNKE